MAGVSPDTLAVAERMRGVLDGWRITLPCANRTCAGLCIVDAEALCIVLKERQHDARVVRGTFQQTGHAWVESTGTIIDITADQFGARPGVYVGERVDARYREVTDDPGFLLHMGPAGDTHPFTCLDDEGEEVLLGTTIEIVDRLVREFGSP